MLEKLRDKRVATLAVALFGGGLLVGCGNSVEGIGNVPMVHCDSHDTPRTNNDTISDVPTGTQLQMGHAIATDGEGHYPANGDFTVTSTGKGEFKVTLNADDTSIVPNGSYRQDSVTISDDGELYAISGSPGPQDSTSLSIDVSCG